MAFVLPAALSSGKGKGKGGGRKVFTAGAALQDLMLLHRKSVKKYLAVPAIGETGQSSALFEGITAPQSWLSPAALAEKLSAESTELINRRVAIINQ